MRSSLHRWIQVSIFNLLLVAFIGVILRYKIAFALPFIDQKHLLHGHSHFAFYGWITQVLLVLLVAYLAARAKPGILKKYRWLLFGNLVTAYGMLVSFSIQGYGSFSIIFSTLSVLVSYAFTIMYWMDLNKLQTREVSHLWFKAALLFNVISSLGIFALSGMMINKIMNQHWYLAAEYFYLHFQYNGWFFFASMGLFTGKITSVLISQKTLHTIFRLFAAAAVPAYFLSVLWMNFPVWIYVIIVIAACIQVLGWAWLLRSLKVQWLILKKSFPAPANWLIKLSAIALSIKLLLQLASVIPSLSNLSYGFRPIIIGYLHLVLLGVITLFLLGFMVADKHISISKFTVKGLMIFASGIIINQIFLMTQGVRAMTYNNIPYIHELLFFAALVMFAGIVIVVVSQQLQPGNVLETKADT